jgi:Tfp pilus assembly protein PilF
MSRVCPAAFINGPFDPFKTIRMRQILTGVILLFSLTGYGQQLTLDQWNEQAKTNIRLLPKYGHVAKTDEQKRLDQRFIDETVQQEQFKGDRTAASNHLISLGFNYLYRGDLKTAMYRFNQAYLLDSLNTDIYWGFGAVYMALGNFEKAKQQYEEGLSQNPDNTHLLTDLGTCFMAHYFSMRMVPENDLVKNPQAQAAHYLDSALTYLGKSYQIDPNNQNTTLKLSTSYYYKGDCSNAWKYYEECKALGGQPITANYTKDLEKKCKRQE